MAFARRPAGRPPTRPTTVSSLLDLRSQRTGRNAAECGEDVAAAAAASALQRPGSAPANVTVDRLFATGVCAFARGQIAESEAAFERASQIARMSDEPEMRAVEKASVERLRLLRTDASAVRVEIKAVEAARRRGSRAHRRGEHTEALRQYDKALSQAAQLMWTCRKAGDSPKETAMQARMQTLLANRAAVHLSLRNFAAAEADARAVLAATPDHRVARACLSAIQQNRTRNDATGERIHAHGSSRAGGAFPRPAAPEPTVPPQRRDPHGAATAAEERARAKKAGFSKQVIQAEHCSNSDRWLVSSQPGEYASQSFSGRGTAGDQKSPSGPASQLRRRERATSRMGTTRCGRLIDLEKDFDSQS